MGAMIIKKEAITFYQSKEILLISYALLEMGGYKDRYSPAVSANIYGNAESMQRLFHQKYSHLEVDI